MDKRTSGSSGSPRYVVFIVIEAATVGLTSIWFAVGALAALVASMFGAEFWLQMVCFLVVSIVALSPRNPWQKRSTPRISPRMPT
jgi:membrane protein implicated in regulation of membrane protease activity